VRPATTNLIGPVVIARPRSVGTGPKQPRLPTIGLRLRNRPLRRRDTPTRNRSHRLKILPPRDTKLKEPLNNTRVKESGPEPAARKTKPDSTPARRDLGFGFLGRGVVVVRHERRTYFTLDQEDRPMLALTV